MIKLPIFILLWVFYIFLIKLPTSILGFFVVPFMWFYRHTNYDDLPWWTRPWASIVEWEGRPGTFKSSLPRWWVLDDTFHPSYVNKGEGFANWYLYHAIRNTGSGLRSFEWIDMDIVPSKVRFKTNHRMKRYEPPEMRELGLTTTWYWAWIGVQAGFKIIHIWNDERHLVIKLGWRVEPEDAKGGDKYFVAGMEDASFAGKVLLYRKG